ncbi:hypothetical protein SB861_24970 [Paraburkholderia sp. SIMBA_049]
MSFQSGRHSGGWGITADSNMQFVGKERDGARGLNAVRQGSESKEASRFDLLSMGVGAILGFTLSAIEAGLLYRELFFSLPIRIIDTLIATFWV